jgi:peptidoglycan/xylan/chitin deacetylase (PgdA/CDA1 family)
MLERLQRWAAAGWWRAVGRVASDRRELYGGATGLRIVTFHETVGGELEQVKQLVGWWRERFPVATPEEADALFAGRWREDDRDRLLVTFDDGLASNHEAARWLAGEGVRAIFFVIPSLVDRTIPEYLRYHERFGVRAHPPLAGVDSRGLSSGELREMVAMGHRVAAHNFAHRDLGRLHDPAAVRYEVANALEGVERLTGGECRDFAIGFGQPENVSEEAAAFLLERGLRVYACHRGLNVPGTTPRFLLRHAVEPDHPFAFTRLCLEGGADRRLAQRARQMVRRVGALPATTASPPRA